jgi:hypothetical protein
MARMAVLMAISILAVAFMAVFLGALCKERMHIKTCGLMKLDVADAPVGAGSSGTPGATAVSSLQLSPIQITSRTRRTLGFKKSPKRLHKAA